MVERVQKREALEKPGIMRFPPGGSREESLSREENK
jgi:hypothetical protein